MSTSRSRRAAALVVAALTVATVGAAAPLAQAPLTDGCAARTVEGDLVSVRPPEFPPPPATAVAVAPVRGQLIDLALDHVDSKRVWVTDGWSIARTVDGGCSWDIVHSLDSAAGSAEAQGGAIVALATPQAEGASGLLYALVQDLSVPGASARFRVLVTADDGASFQERGDGLGTVNVAGDSPRCGDDTRCDLLGTREPNTVYVRFSSPDRTAIHRSGDQGRTFAARNAVTDFAPSDPANGLGEEPPQITDMAVDPYDVNRIWASSSSMGPAQSQDGGRSFTRYPTGERFQIPLASVRHVDVARYDANPTGQAVIVVAGRDIDGRERIAVSVRGGEVFVPAGDRDDDVVPAPVTAMALGSELTIVVATELGVQVKRGLGQGRNHVVAGTKYGLLHRIRSGAAFTRVSGAALRVVEPFWAINDRAIIQIDVGSNGERFDLGLELPPLPDPLAIPDDLPGMMNGPRLVELAVGEQRELDYQLEVGAEPIRLDVFFLIDETGSMQDEFDALALGFDRIAKDLVAAKVDVEVGLGTYGNGFRYHRYRQIGPYDQEFQTRLESVRAGGDGEVAYTGLHQVATGSGLKRSRAGNGVSSGMDAKWRSDSLRIVIHATDEGLSVEPEGPFIEETYQALRDHRIRHIGLIANDPTRAAQYDWAPMFELALQTGALAPPGRGIDCNRDGVDDIQPGDPIACFLSPLSTNATINDVDVADLVPDLADVIVEILQAETSFATVNFSRSKGQLLAGFRSTDSSSRADFRKPVVKHARALAVCTESTAGQTEDVRLLASTAARLLGGLTVRIVCGTQDGPAVAAAVAPIIGPVITAAPAAPPAPIQAPSITQGAVQSGVQSLASSNSLVPQAGAAAAKQEQQQHQQAGIGRDQGGEQHGLNLEFSARRDRVRPEAVTLIAGAAMALGAGVVRRRQMRTEPTRVRVRGR